jgi:hypothetical protein
MRSGMHIVLISLLLFCATGMRAGDKQSTYQVYINAPDQSIRANVMSSNIKIDADPGRTYHWYAFNKVIETKGGYDGKLLHGEYSSFYLNSNLKEKGQFRKGLKHGKWISWYDNGSIKDITMWKNGEKNGIYRSFTSNGEPVLEARFADDKIHGKVTSFENGKILSIRKYRKGKEVVKKPARVKERKPRKKKPQEISPETKEGVNVTTMPADEPAEKRTIKEKVRSLLTPNNRKQKKTDSKEEKKAAMDKKRNKKKDKEKKAPEEKQEKKTSQVKEQEK